MLIDVFRLYDSSNSEDEMETEERQTLQRLYNALEEIKGIAAHMPVSQIMAFLLVVLHENKPLKDLAHLADSNISTMSRQMIDLGTRNRRMEPGYMLIDQRQNPLNLRENQYILTLKGNHLVKSLLKHLQSKKGVA